MELERQDMEKEIQRRQEQEIYRHELSQQLSQKQTEQELKRQLELQRKQELEERMRIADEMERLKLNQIQQQRDAYRHDLEQQVQLSK